MSDSKYNNFPDASYGGLYEKKMTGALQENSNLNDSGDMGDHFVNRDEEDEYLDENQAIENLEETFKDEFSTLRLK